MDTNLILVPAEESISFLSDMYLWGIEVIKVIQRIKSPALTSVLKFITAFGTEMFYVPVILFIFWWVDEKRGLRFGILIMISAWINSFMKDLLKQPRPFNIDPSLGLATEPTYGAPSGHAQMSFCFWIPFAAWLDKIITAKTIEKQKQFRHFIWGIAIFMVLLIGFTRLYLGVHFPTDLFAGWILGLIILAVYFIPGPFLTKRLDSAGIRVQNICAALAALTMNSLYPVDRMLPAVFLGFCLGYNIMRRNFPFSAAEKTVGKKPLVCVMRCLTGFAGMTLIYSVLRLILPGEGSLFRGIPLWGQYSPYYEIGRFLRYGAIGLWASAGAPYVFQRMGLALVGKSGGGDRRGEDA